MNNALTHKASRFKPGPEMSRQYRDALSEFPTGVTIITCQSDIGPLGITVNSFTSVSVDPPLVMWCVTKASQRYKAFMETRHFAIHIMPSDTEDLCLSFARSGQAFDRTHWHLSKNQVPILESCLAYLECSYFKDYDGGDHSILLGLVDEVSVFEGVPLAFAKGRFNRLEERGV